MADQLAKKRVAALVANGFEQVELLDPRKALEDAGATVHVVSPERETVRGWNHTEWGENVKVDKALDEVRAGDYDALLLPGGVMNPDKLRSNPKAVELVKQFFENGKPIAVICHGPWTLIEAGVVRGVKMTSYPSVKTDLRNAGAEWIDQEVVVDRGIVSSRKPDDLPAFNRKMIEEFAEGQHGGAGKRERARAEV
jgi:protease I